MGEEDMLINEFQQQALRTASYPGRGTGEGGAFSYLGLKLASEAGEVAGKLGKKMLRDGTDTVMVSQFSDDERIALVLELGDVLWYVAAIADELGFSLEYVAKANNVKLERRQRNDTIVGEGDHR